MSLYDAWYVLELYAMFDVYMPRARRCLELVGHGAYNPCLMLL